jgi:hypothetical protein
VNVARRSGDVPSILEFPCETEIVTEIVERLRSRPWRVAMLAGLPAF